MSEFQSQRIVQSQIIQIAAAPDQVFPLLCPVREYEWIHDWSCHLVYSKSGVAEAGCIFQTDRPGEGRRTWVVSRYEPGEAIGFVIFQHDGAVITLDLSLAGNDNATTRMQVTHTLIGLNENGNTAIANLPADYIRKRWDWLREALNHYLTTGKTLKP
jgi:hypothetical protein